MDLALVIAVPVGCGLLVIIACIYFACCRKRSNEADDMAPPEQTSISQTSGAPYACPNCSQAFLVTTSSHLGTSLVSCPRCNTTLSVTGVAIGTALLPSSLPASSAAGGMSSDGGAAVGGSSQAAGAGDAYVRMPV